MTEICAISYVACLWVTIAVAAEVIVLVGLLVVVAGAVMHSKMRRQRREHHDRNVSMARMTHPSAETRA